MQGLQAELQVMNIQPEASEHDGESIELGVSIASQSSLDATC